MAESSVPRRIWKAVSSPVGLFILLIVYSFGGAAVFKSIEGPHESHEKHTLVDMRNEIITDLWNNSHTFKNRNLFAKLVKDELKKYESQLYTAYTQGINTASESTVWDFWGSMVYCATVYTTIGYGHIAPATTTGRIMTMVYAAIGIPLCLIVLAEFGKLLTFALKFLYSYPRRLIKSCKPGDPADYPINEEFNLPIWVAIAVSMVYMFGGAVMYQAWEEWSYLEGFYFIFISISTIGFGDILPTHNKFFLASFIYQLFGLALVAMVINVIMDAMQVHLEQVRGKVVETAKTIGIDLSAEPAEEAKDKTE